MLSNHWTADINRSVLLSSESINHHKGHILVLPNRPCLENVCLRQKKYKNREASALKSSSTYPKLKNLHNKLQDKERNTRLLLFASSVVLIVS